MAETSVIGVAAWKAMATAVQGLKQYAQACSDAEWACFIRIAEQNTHPETESKMENAHTIKKWLKNAEDVLRKSLNAKTYTGKQSLNWDLVFSRIETCCSLVDDFTGYYEMMQPYTSILGQNNIPYYQCPLVEHLKGLNFTEEVARQICIGLGAISKVHLWWVLDADIDKLHIGDTDTQKLKEAVRVYCATLGTNRGQLRLTPQAQLEYMHACLLGM